MVDDMSQRGLTIAEPRSSRLLLLPPWRGADHRVQSQLLQLNTPLGHLARVTCRRGEWLAHRRGTRLATTRAKLGGGEFE